MASFTTASTYYSHQSNAIVRDLRRKDKLVKKGKWEERRYRWEPIDHIVSAYEAVRICNLNKGTQQKRKRYYTIGMWDKNRKVKVIWDKTQWGGVIISAYTVHF